MVFLSLTRIDKELDGKITETPVIINTKMVTVAYVLDDCAEVYTLNGSMKVKEVNKIRSITG